MRTFENWQDMVMTIGYMLLVELAILPADERYIEMTEDRDHAMEKA